MADIAQNWTKFCINHH